jgi:hypothetical protein
MKLISIMVPIQDSTRVSCFTYLYIKWVPCHSVVHPYDTDGCDLQTWRITTNSLTKHSQTADVGHKEVARFVVLYMALGLALCFA